MFLRTKIASIPGKLNKKYRKDQKLYAIIDHKCKKSIFSNFILLKLQETYSQCQVLTYQHADKVSDILRKKQLEKLEMV